MELCESICLCPGSQTGTEIFCTLPHLKMQTRKKLFGVTPARAIASVTLLVSVALTQFSVAAESLRISKDSDGVGSTCIENSSSTLATPEETLKVLTYNVQFRPAIADVFRPAWPNTSERAQAIGHAVAQYDIVALQEVFRPDRLDEIVHAAELADTESGAASRLPSGHLFDVAIGPAPRRLSSP